MSTRAFIVPCLAFVAGWAAGVVFEVLPTGYGAGKAAAQSHGVAKSTGVDVSKLQADLERLKTVVPDQAHAMKDVDYHFTNLWFAGKSENWPLADFYWRETLSHLKWAVRIMPIRKDNAGREIKLEEILQAIENSFSIQMASAIQQQHADRFKTTYRAMLEGCYLCHKASDKHYLRLKVPDQPATAIMNFDPAATRPR